MANKKRVFDQGQNVRAIARERIGIVPSRKVFQSKKDKEKETPYDEFDDEGTIDCDEIDRILDQYE